VHRGFVILDQAYVEFGGYNAAALVAEHPNLVVTRTLSKAFGGASLRVGYLIGAPEVVAVINRIKLPYNINAFSEQATQALVARSSLMRQRVDEIVASRGELYEYLGSLPLDNVYPSDANFVLIRCADKEDLFAFLRERSILVRDVSKYAMLERCLRISVGTKEENEKVRSALQSYFAVKRAITS
jgi:histidinol-phosphate aminotransferase